MNPLEVKKTLARQLVDNFHGLEASNKASDHFENVYQRGNVPTEIQSIEIETQDSTINRTLTKLLVEHSLVDSRSEAKRLLVQGGIQVDGQKMEADDVALEDGNVLRVGRHKWARIVLVGR